MKIALSPSGGDDTQALYDACQRTAGQGARGVVDLEGVYKITTLDLRQFQAGILRGTSTLAGNQIGPSYNATTFKGLSGTPVVLMPENAGLVCGWEIGGIKFSGGSDQLSFGAGGCILNLHDLIFEDAEHAGIAAKGVVQDWIWDRIVFRANAGATPQYGFYYHDPGTSPTMPWFHKGTFRNVRAQGMAINGIRIDSRYCKGVSWEHLIVEASGQDNMVLAGGFNRMTFLDPTFEACGWSGKPSVDLRFVAGPDGPNSDRCTLIGGQYGARNAHSNVQYGIDAEGYNPKGRLTLVNPYMPGLPNHDPNGVIGMVA